MSHDDPCCRFVRATSGSRVYVAAARAERGPTARGIACGLSFHRDCLPTPTWIRKSGTTSSGVRTDWPDCWRSRVNNHLTPCARIARHEHGQKWNGMAGSTWLRSGNRRRTVIAYFHAKLQYIYIYLFFLLRRIFVYAYKVPHEEPGLTQSTFIFPSFANPSWIRTSLLSSPFLPFLFL
jgi:hypothetical protein